MITLSGMMQPPPTIIGGGGGGPVTGVIAGAVQVSALVQGAQKLMGTVAGSVQVTALAQGAPKITGVVAGAVPVSALVEGFVPIDTRRLRVLSGPSLAIDPRNQAMVRALPDGHILILESASAAAPWDDSTYWSDGTGWID